MHASPDILIPITFFISIVAIFWIIHRSRRLANQDIQITLRAIIESGQQLSPELLEALGNNVTNRRAKDLRRGVILVSIGVSITIFALFLAEAGRTGGILMLVGISTAFVVLGLTYIGFWKFTPSIDKE